MDTYSLYKGFGEIMKAKKHLKLSDQEVEYKSDGETEVDLKHI